MWHGIGTQGRHGAGKSPQGTAEWSYRQRCWKGGCAGQEGRVLKVKGKGQAGRYKEGILKGKGLGWSPNYRGIAW